MRLVLKCGFEVLKQTVNLQSVKLFAKKEHDGPLICNCPVHKSAVKRVRWCELDRQPALIRGRVRVTGIPVRVGYGKDRIVLLAPPCNPVVVAVDIKEVRTRVIPYIY